MNVLLKRTGMVFLLLVVAGCTGNAASAPTSEPKVYVVVDLQKAAEHGVKPRDIYLAIDLASKAGHMNTLSDLENISVPSADGPVKLLEVAAIESR